MEELKPCQFCGKRPEIAVCDNEGNVRGEEYERDPWSGLGYRIVHISEDCPLATDDDGGSNIYDTMGEAERHWNRRAERTCNVESSHVEQEIGDYSYLEVELSCGHAFTWDDGTPPDYCPNCGAKVVVE